MKIFKGIIVILRTKTNSGIILLEDGSETQSIKFPAIFSDRDEVEVSFIDDQPLNNIRSLVSRSEEKYYGFINYFNGYNGRIVGTYPLAVGDIQFSINDFPSVVQYIEEYIPILEKVVEELESVDDIKSTNETVIKNLKDIGQIFNQTFSIKEVASDLNDTLGKAKIELNKKLYHQVNSKITMFFSNLWGNKENLKNIDDIPITLDLIKKLDEMDGPEVGQEFDVRVNGIEGYGAFVDYAPGREGLLHISELEWNRVENVEDVLNIGDEVRVKLIEIKDDGKLSFSRKALLEKPGSLEEPPLIPGKYISLLSEINLGLRVSFEIHKAIGNDHIQAKDINIIDADSDELEKCENAIYGKIIEKSGRYYFINRKARVKDMFADGNKNKGIDATQLAKEDHFVPEVGQEFDAIVTVLQEYGAFVDYAPGRGGLLHISELEWNRVENVEDVLNTGDEVRVKLIEIKDDGKLSFSRKALLEKPGYLRGLEVEITPEDFKNFISVDNDAIYCIYDMSGGKEVYKLNENNRQELISCYKDYDTEDKIKYQIIDKLIDLDLKIHRFEKEKLLEDKKELIKHLILYSRASKDKKRLAIELMQIDYNYDNLKEVIGTGEINLDIRPVQIPDDYQTNYSISDIIKQNKQNKDDLAMLDNYDTNHSIKELLR
jgi:predicted RNA-binding protein with RPS1 domain